MKLKKEARMGTNLLEALPGVAVGGSLGYISSEETETPKMKTINTLVGAGIGGAASSAAGKTTRTVKKILVSKNTPWPNPHKKSVRDYKTHADVLEDFKDAAKVEGKYGDDVWDFLKAYWASLDDVTIKANKGIKDKIDNSFFGMGGSVKDSKKMNLSGKAMYNDNWRDLLKTRRKAQQASNGNFWDDFNGSKSTWKPKGSGTYKNMGMKSRDGKLYDLDGNEIRTKHEVKNRYRDLTKQYHPDRPGGNEAKMKEVVREHEDIKKSSLWDKLAYFTANIRR